MPALDCLILELEDSLTIESSYALARSPASLLYCVTDLQNQTVKGIIVSNREKRDRAQALGGLKLEEHDEATAPSTSLTYHLLRTKTLFTYLNIFILKENNIRPKDLWAFLSELDEEYIFNSYCKMLEVFNLMQYMPVGEARELIKKYFEAFSTEVNLFQLESKYGTEGLEEDTRVDSAYVLNLRDIKWKVINMVSSFDTFTEEELELRSDPDPRENVLEILEMILSKDRFFERKALAFPLRFVIMGGSKELQVVCQNFGALFETRPNLFESTKLYIYVVPHEYSDLAQYLSEKDPWYRRHVHSVFFRKVFYPSDDYVEESVIPGMNIGKVKKNIFNETIKKEVGYQTILPNHLEYKMLNASLQNFVNFAGESLQLPIYKVECTVHTKNAGRNKQTFFFCESIQIGMEAALVQSMATEGKADPKQTIRTASFQEQFNKEVSIKPLELSIKYTEVLPSNAEDFAQNGIEQKPVFLNKKLLKVGFFSIPPLSRKDDPASEAASPHLPLYMSLLDADGNRSRQGLASDEGFSRNDKRIQEAIFRGTYVSSYVSEAEISLPSQMMVLPLVVDGRIFGRFSTFKISPVLSKDNKRLNLSVRCFQRW